MTLKVTFAVWNLSNTHISRSVVWIVYYVLSCLLVIVIVNVYNVHFLMAGQGLGDRASVERDAV